MAGFGGDARLALLSGVVNGINQRREKQQQAERQAILNRLAQVQVEQAQAGVEIRQRQQDEIERQARLKAVEDERVRAAETRRLGGVAAVIRRRNPELSAEEAMAIAGELSPSGYTALVTPPEEEEDKTKNMTPLQQIQYEARARELHHEQRLSELENSDVGRRLRRTVLNPAYKSELVGATELARQAGFSEEEINDYIGTVQPKTPEGKPKLTRSQSAALRLNAQAEAQQIIQALGSAAAALGALREEGPEPDDEEYYSMLVDAVQDAMRAEGTTSMDAFGGGAAGATDGADPAAAATRGRRGSR